MEEALDRAKADGVETVIVQPTHLMAGLEYTDIKDELDKRSNDFKQVALGEPLLASDADYQAVAEAIAEQRANLDDGACAFVLMGHGTTADSNADYATMQRTFDALGKKQFFVGTVEAEPTCEDVIAGVQAAGYAKAVLSPFMVVAATMPPTTWQTPPTPIPGHPSLPQPASRPHACSRAWASTAASMTSTSTTSPRRSSPSNRHRPSRLKPHP